MCMRYDLDSSKVAHESFLAVVNLTRQWVQNAHNNVLNEIVVWLVLNPEYLEQ